MIHFLKEKKEYSIETESHLNLLGHAQLIELDVGSECGGHGICGKDRILIENLNREDFSPPTEAEKKHLSLEEIEKGIRLSCQCFPRDEKVTAKIQIKISRS